MRSRSLRPAPSDQRASPVGEFEKLAPGRKFTPDGHLVGSIGELIAATVQGLTLTLASIEEIDTTRTLPDCSTRSVEIKATQRTSFVVRHERPRSDDFIALTLGFHEGTWDTGRHGPAAPARDLLGKKMPSSAQWQVSVGKLQTLAEEHDYRDEIRY